MCFGQRISTLLLWSSLAAAIGLVLSLLATDRAPRSGLAPLALEARIAESTDDARFECVPFTAGKPTLITRTFEAHITGGTGRYAIRWNFNAARRMALISSVSR
jgi:hypothetical protein